MASVYLNSHPRISILLLVATDTLSFLYLSIFPQLCLYLVLHLFSLLSQSSTLSRLKNSEGKLGLGAQAVTLAACTAEAGRLQTQDMPGWHSELKANLCDLVRPSLRMKSERRARSGLAVGPCLESRSVGMRCCSEIEPLHRIP